MGAFLFYMLKSGGCLILFYILFKLLLSQHTFFRFNRLTLLLGMLGCTLLPLVELTTAEENFLHQPLQMLQQILEETPVSQFIDETDMSLSVHVKATSGRGGWFAVALGYFYLVGATFTLGWLSLSSFRMFQLIRHAARKKYGKYILVIASQPVTSFSWGRYIVLSTEDYLQHREEILLHETMHLRNRHTLDLLLMQFFLIFYWFNPVIWLLKREMQEIHEFEADDGVINTGIDATRYQLLLVKKAVGTRLYSMANGFNHSKLKKRITMMLKERTNRWVRLKLLLVVPVMAGTLYAFARPEVKETFIAATDGNRQSEAENDYWTLNEFFRKERDAFHARTKDKTVKAKASHLLVNKRNQILFNSDPVKPEDLQAVLVKELSDSWKDSHGKYVQCISCTFDLAANEAELGKICQKVKNAYMQVREKIASETSNNNRTYLDSVFPIVVYETAPQKTTDLQDKDIITGITVTLHKSGDKSQKALSNFTLGELKKEVAAWKTASDTPEEFTVGLKVDKNCQMRVVNAVKNVLREAAVLKVNVSK